MIKVVRRWWHIFVLAVASYVPMLFTRPGIVSADTKSYLYLNPSELLSEASSLWSSSVGAGTVTHQYIGYLWPMGPYFWLCETVGLPDWVAQRLWWGSLIFLASLGTYRLAKTLSIGSHFAIVAAFFYGFSPYSLHYLARLSGILLPWVGLPWLIMCLIRARRDSSWRWMALAILIIGSIGTVNATALFFILIGVALWLLGDVLTGESRLTDALRTGIIIGCGSVVVSLWWIVSLVVQSRYGLPILRYTETYDTVAKASLPHELLRGLGYWFFYGADETGRWIGPSAPYSYNRLVIVAGFAAAAVGLISLACSSKKFRIHLALLTLIGMGIATGASPLTQSSWYGSVFHHIVSNESGFALRSTPRALPLVLLGLSLATASGLHALAQWCRLQSHSRIWSHLRTRVVPLAYLAVISVLVINNFPWFTQGVITDSIAREEQLPAYWTELAKKIDEQRELTTGFGRTYEFPASNFADHSWGGTIDPILPGLLKSEYIAKEMVPQGSEATTDLLSAFESHLVDGRPDVSVLGSLAAILSANTVTWRGDLAYDHFLTARPEYLAPALASSPPGQTLFQGPLVNTMDAPSIVDETWYANTLNKTYPLVQSWTVPQPRPLLSLSPRQQLVTVVGSGEGVIHALSAQALSAQDTFVYAGSREYFPSTLRDQSIAHLIITDTNRKAERQWSSIAQQTGRTETIDEPAHTGKTTDQRLNPFTDNYRAIASTSHMSTSRLVGDIARVEASSYGHHVVMNPESRPHNAVDSNPTTAWVVAVQKKAIGQWIHIDYRAPVTTSRITLDLRTKEPGNRVLEQVRLDAYDSTGTSVLSRLVDIDQQDRVATTFDSTTFSSLRLTITAESFSDRIDYSTAPGIAIGEISIPQVRSAEYIAVPSETQQLFSKADKTTVVLTRQSIDPSIPHRRDAEVNIQRIVTSPTTANFTIRGTLRLAGNTSEELMSEQLGLPLSQSNRRLWNSPASIASLAFDGNLSTAWTSPLDQAIGSELTFLRPLAGSSQNLHMYVRDDTLHSVPTSIVIRDANEREFTVALTGARGHLVASLPNEVQLPLRSLMIDDVAPVTFPNYFTKQPRQLPVSIREINLGADAPLRTPTIDGSCRNDLVTINDKSVPIRILDNSDVFNSTKTMQFTACASVVLEPGDNYIRTERGRLTGFDFDAVILQSASPTSASTSDLTGVTISSRSATRVTAKINVVEPMILSFGQSINSGWKATLLTDKESISLGDPFVVQGYANGWLVPESGTLTLTWSPQRSVSWAIVISLIFALGLLVLAVIDPRRNTQQYIALQRSRWVNWIVAALLIVVLTALTGPLVTAVGLVLRFLHRYIGALVVALMMGIIAGVIVIGQMRYQYPANLDWPMRYDYLAPAAWMAITAACINPLLRRK